MIHGHGDDLYKYDDVRMNFSSNIPSHADLSALEAFLCSRLSVIRSYPEPSAHSLETEIAHSIGRKPEEVLVTSGATEAIYLIAQAARELLPHEGGGATTYTIVRPTFSEYESASRMFGLREAGDGDLCWICNPNNPTGEVFGERFVRDLSRRHRLLVIDQSYEDYVPSALPQVADAIVLHSMTKKYCIPGLRLGYVTAPASVVDCLRRHCRPWAVNALALEAGKWLTGQPGPCNAPLLAEAQRLRTALGKVQGIAVAPTQTNFMLCTIAGHTAAELKEHLVHRHGILIRDASNFQGLTPHHFRVAAQSPGENDELVRAIQEYV